MPTPQQYAGQTGAVRPMNGAVPGLTWDQFMSAINNGTNIAANYTQPAGAYTMGEGGGFSGGITPRAYDIPGLGTVGIIANGGQDAYTQDVGDGTTNWFTRNPDGTVGSQNRTQNNDSWWDSTGLPLVASLAFGGATAGLSAAGVGVSGAGAGAANVGAGALGADGASAAFGGGAGAAGSAAGNLGTFPQYGTGFEGGDGFLNVSADAAGQGAAGTAAQEAATNPSWLQQAQSYYAGLDPLTKFGVGTLGSTITSGLAGNGGGDNSFSSLVNGYGGSGGIDFSSLGSTDTGGSSWLSGLLGGASSAYGAVKDFTGMNGQQLLSAGGSLLNGILGTNAANKAANAQTNAANQSNQLAALIYGNNTAMNKPFVDAGTGAVNQMASLDGLNGAAAQTAAKGQFTTDPGYQFALDQGMRGVQSSAAASGGLFSGRAAKDLNNYAQGQASQQYGNYYNRLSGLAGIGQASANQQAANGNAYSNTFGSNTAAAGNAAAAGAIGGANAITGSISSALNGYSQNQLTQLLLNQQKNGYYNTNGSV